MNQDKKDDKAKQFLIGGGGHRLFHSPDSCSIKAEQAAASHTYDNIASAGKFINIRNSITANSQRPS
jgi:hypothetical protein